MSTYFEYTTHPWRLAAAYCPRRPARSDQYQVLVVLKEQQISVFLLASYGGVGDTVGWG